MEVEGQKPLVMRIKIKMLVLGIGFLWIGFGCAEEQLPNCDGDNDQLIETFFEEDFEELNCHLQNIVSNGTETHLIIKNQDDYEKYFNCLDELPSIGFDQFFILAGVYNHHQCATFDRQWVVLCGDRLIYQVRMQEQDCHSLTTVQFFTVLKKEFANKKIEFNVQFNN